MKILLLLLLITIPLFSQQEQTASPNQASGTYNRFGMEILPISYGLSFHISPFPLSFYVANDRNEIISFGLDINISLYYNSSNNEYDIAQGIGGHIGFGKMYQSKREQNLYLGYLLNFSAGYISYSFYDLPFYIGFSPNLILEINQFIFKAGFYLDSSLNFASTITFGFLLDNE